LGKKKKRADARGKPERKTVEGVIFTFPRPERYD